MNSRRCFTTPLNPRQILFLFDRAFTVIDATGDDLVFETGNNFHGFEFSCAYTNSPIINTEKWKHKMAGFQFYKFYLVRV